MKTHTLTTLFVIALVLAACQPATPIPQTATLTPNIMPAPTPTGTPSYVRYVSTEPYAYYDFDDSFENISDLGAYGITSAQNTVKVNTTNHAMGQQSIQVNGSIGGGQNDLSFVFSVQKILGSSSYDFSNKTIVLSVFIPADSPIGEIWFEADRGDERVTVTSAKVSDPSDPVDPVGRYGGTTNLPKGQWVEAVIDIQGVSSNISKWGYAWGPNGDLTDAEALDVIRNCDVFKIQGMLGTSGGPFSTSFLLDDLRWLDRASINIDTNADSLRKYAADTHLYVGSAADYNQVFGVTDAKFSQVLAQEFNLLVPELSVNWNFLEPSEGDFDFSKMDAMVDFAIGNNMAVFSYGVWHFNLPAWLKDKSFSELGPILTNYIDIFGRRYRGKIAIWNVFNEVMNDAGDGFRNRSPDHQLNDHIYSPWVDGNDTSLIKAAFRQARISDPNAILILNDFDTEEIRSQRSEFFYNFVSELVAEGVPIDGVGFELHLVYGTRYNLDWESDLPTYLSKVDANVKRYAALGLKVVFSEVDVPIYIKDIDANTATGQAELTRRINYAAQIYGGLIKVALDNPNVIVFNTWTFTDRYSWFSDPAQVIDPLKHGFADMFDQDYKPKPAYYEVLNALMNWR